MEPLGKDGICEHQGADLSDDLFRQSAYCGEEFERGKCDVAEDKGYLHSKDLTDGGKVERFTGLVAVQDQDIPEEEDSEENLEEPPDEETGKKQ